MAVDDPGPAQDPERRSASEGARRPQSETPIRPWAAFAFRDYRILWLSSVAGIAAMQMSMVAFGAWVDDVFGSSLVVGFLVILLGILQVPVQLLGILFGGALADLWDRKKLIASAHALGFVFMALVAARAAFDILETWQVSTVTVILAVSAAFGAPAHAAITANLVPRAYLMHAVTTNQAAFQIGAIAAPLAFAAVVSYLGATAAFALSALFALPAFVLPLFIRTCAASPDGRFIGLWAMLRQTNVYAKIWEGFVYVRSHPILPGFYILDIGVTIVGSYRQILPLIAERLLRGGGSAVSTLTAASSYGGVAGTFAVLFLARFSAKGMLVLYATLVYGILLIVFGLSMTASLWLAAALVAGLGAAEAIGMAARQTTVQLTTHDHMRGRAVSIHSASVMIANIGTFGFGFMSEEIGANNAMLLGGIMSVAIVIAVWRLWRGIREYRYP